jgi:hypothetical protein
MLSPHRGASWRGPALSALCAMLDLRKHGYEPTLTYHVSCVRIELHRDTSVLCAGVSRKTTNYP